MAAAVGYAIGQWQDRKATKIHQFFRFTDFTLYIRIKMQIYVERWKTSLLKRRYFVGCFYFCLQIHNQRLESADQIPRFFNWWVVKKKTLKISSILTLSPCLTPSKCSVSCPVVIIVMTGRKAIANYIEFRKKKRLEIFVLSVGLKIVDIHV